jgi:hypothetical protein
VRQGLLRCSETRLYDFFPYLLQVRALGTLSAPIGTVTIVFASVVGASQLLTEVPEATRQALSVFQVSFRRSMFLVQNSVELLVQSKATV